MDIIHRIDFEPEDAVEPTLDALGIQYEKLPFVNRVITRVRLSESAPQWPKFRALYTAKGKTWDVYETYFSKEEILAAEWLRINGGFLDIDYPQPERRWQEEHFNYEAKCPNCGAFRQVSSFFIKAEPKSRRYDFMSLYWTSALLASPRVFTVLEEKGIQGYERWPAFINKTQEPATTVAQLFVSTVAAPGIVGAEDLDPVVCPVCGAFKYNKYHKRGVMYLCREAIPAGVDMFETYEWFGDGHQPRRELIVSNRFVRLFYAEKWKGLFFKVAETI